MLNRNQKQAVNCQASRILCLAGPGTGKTKTLIERIIKLVTVDNVSPDAILAVTFTNVAAFEMKARYEAACPDRAVPEFRTFHSFCYHLLATDLAVLKSVGYAQVPDIADEAAEKRITKEAMLQIGLSLPEKKLYGQVVLSQQEAYDLMLILKATDRLMKKKNLITFNMLCKHICDLFINDAPEIRKYKDQYKHILVDEYQDTDKLQHKFVTSFESSNIFVVGDAQQALYAFRGADSRIIKELSKDEDWATIKLTKNYRSTKQICKYVNRFSRSYAEDSYRVEVESDVVGPEVITSSYISPEGRGEVPHSIIKEIVDAHRNVDETCAILVRSNAEVAYIQSQLVNMNVPHNTSTTDSDVVGYLKCILSDEYTIDWLASYLPNEYYLQYIRESATRNNPYTLNEFIERHSNYDIQNRVSKIYELRRACNSSQPFSVICNDILKILHCKNVKVNLAEVKNNGNTLSNLIDAIVGAVNNTQAQHTDLYVGTVHSVKGLEYDSVYVIGASGRSWKLSDDDNRNVFYVAASRAKTNLTIYFAQ